MALLFIHGGEKLKVDSDSKQYTDGSYNAETWARYLGCTEDLRVMFRVDRDTFSPEEARQKFEPFPLNPSSFRALPNVEESLRSFLGIRTRAVRRRAITEEVKNSEAVIVRLPGAAGTIAAKAARKLGKPYLVEAVGCPWDSLWNHGWRGKLLAPFATLAMRRVCRNAPFVIYVTSRFLQRRYPTTGQSISCSDVVITPGTEERLTERLAAIDRLGGRARFTLGTACAVDVPYKGHATVIRALSILKSLSPNTEYRYKLAGNGDASRLGTIAENNGVLSSVEFLGPLGKDAMKTFYDDLDLYVQPSHQEGLSRAVIEAMSRACPVAATPVGGNPELIADKFLFGKRSAEDLAQLIAGLSLETLRSMAQSNFHRSQQYTDEILAPRRARFMETFWNSRRQAHQ
ncbi:glycosyltransferase family 4 protein [Brachybacterium huguangmaarense]|uniref:Glycosyltransferase family 4 protein n=1 Tax=Brachybacterium huguangmaarense TaxID=1652028 RepID=A0ABY6G2C5_9MICO|nr:glycosyltransferase family 4 protein [Brachybacterium huguangmaarense]UYG17267.1 glycosyltransferase family 4 protein [Brachybacterium huguangmaarense]